MTATAIKRAAFAAAIILCCQSGTSAQAQTTGKTACVASALGHAFRVQKIGVMVFGNAMNEVATGSWGIDDYAVGRIQGILRGKYAMRRLPLSTQNLGSLEQAGAGGLLFGGSGAAVAGPLRSAAGGARCDLYITVTRAGATVAGTNQAIGGLGILEHAGIFERVYVHAIFDVRTYDSNLTLLRTERAAINPLLVSGMTPPGIYGMYRKVDASWIPAPPQAAAQSAQLKNAARDLVGQGLAKTLPAMLQGS